MRLYVDELPYNMYLSEESENDILKILTAVTPQDYIIYGFYANNKSVIV